MNPQNVVTAVIEEWPKQVLPWGGKPVSFLGPGAIRGYRPTTF
jgi:hypothetical protein